MQILAKRVRAWAALMSAVAFPTEGRPARVDHPVAPKRDSNFGCELSKQRLRAWLPRGYTLPQGMAGKFKYWKSAETRETAFAECLALPTKFIIREEGAGNVSRFDLIVAQEGVQVYRAFSKGPFSCGDKSPAKRNGVWWSFDRAPRKPAFRKLNAICPEWNDLSMRVSCTLKAGTVVAVGPTQSAACRTEPTGDCPSRPAAWAARYDSSRQHQVYLNLFNRPESEISKFLTNCRVTPWTDKE